MTSSTNYATWCSVDPVRRKVDVYPKSISMLIEKSYQERSVTNASACVLGSNFFNATIHFHPSGSVYQTTPGMSLGRAGFKQPGYRSVRRICANDPTLLISIYAKQVHGEWRIAGNELDSDFRFDERISRDLWFETSDNIGNVVTISNWKPEDIDSSALDKNVIVWQWCRGLPENQGDLTRLSDSWWVPYNYQNNETIENAFKNGEYNVDNVNIELPLIGERTIEFIQNSCYAKQISPDRTKVRFVRRVIKTVQMVKTMFDRISNPQVDIATIIAGLPDGTIPHHFNCPILQDIMSDPVKTADNHVYDRQAIERWFTINNTSPLTGLSLPNKTLVPHIQLKIEIDAFLEKLLNPEPPVNTNDDNHSDSGDSDDSNSSGLSNHS
tara:strand:- start:6509 stop:7657 length:1149 start_codon:yes stop_codon:yes gene_type:complete